MTNKRIVYASIFILVLFLMIVLSINASQQHDETNYFQQQLLRRTTSLLSDVQQLTAQPNLSLSMQQTLQTMQLNLVQMHQVLNAKAGQADVEALNNQIKTLQRDMDNQFSQLAKNNNDLKNPATENTFSSTTSLPFSIYSIDSLNDNIIVTVNNAQLLMPLTIGDKVAGWQLTKASLNQQTAIFENANGNQMRMQLHETL